MTDLSLEEINQVSPYRVECGEGIGTFRFESEKGVSYAINFIDDDIIRVADSYQLVIANLNHKKSPRDKKVKETILCIVEEFFNKNQSVLVYICETSDGKQLMRNRLFTYWFSTYSNRLRYTLVQSSVKDEYDVINNVALIVRNDNPHISEIMSEFSTTVNLLSDKPDER